MINTILWAFKTSAGHHDHVKAETPGNFIAVGPPVERFTLRGCDLSSKLTLTPSPQPLLHGSEERFQIQESLVKRQVRNSKDRYENIW